MKRKIKLYVFMLALWSCSFAGMGQALEDLQKEAAANNPGLQAKYKEFEAAMEKVEQMSSLPDPTLSMGYFISPVETRVGPQRMRFSLSQMFPWFGTLKAQGDAAALLAESKFQTFIDARNNLYYQVAAAYYPLYEIEENIKLQHDNLAILDSYKSISTNKFENARGSMVDVLRVEIMKDETQTNIDILEARKKPLLTTLNNLLNRNAHMEVVVADTLRVDVGEQVELADSLWADHPKLKELSLKEEAMKQQEKAAFKQGLPRLGAGLDYVLVDKRTDMAVPDNGKDVVMPMVTVSIPIFRGKYKAAAKEAQLMQEAYAKMQEDTQNTLLSGYEDALFMMEKNRQFVQLYRNQIRTTQQALNLLLSAYTNENKDFEEVLRMQQQLLKYQMLQVSAVAEYKTAEARLDYITGKNTNMK